MHKYEGKQKIVQGRGLSNINLGIFVFSLDVCRASLPFPSINYVSIEKIYETLEKVFHRLSKHLEFRQIYSAARRIFSSLFGVRLPDGTLFLVFDILRHWEKQY